MLCDLIAGVTYKRNIACLFLCVMLLLDNVLPVIALLICEALQECLKFRFWVFSVFLLACPQVTCIPPSLKKTSEASLAPARALFIFC